MTTLREAAQQALEALKLSTPKTRRADDDYAEQGWTEHNTAITALRAALAQEQAEPVAWLQPKTMDAHLRPDLGYEACSSGDYGAFPVYRAPPKAEQEQEPVAWLYEAGTDRTLHWQEPPLYGTPLFTAPPKRKPLSEEEVADIVVEMNGNEPTALFWRDLARAIERAHGIIEPQINGDSRQTLDDAMRLPRAMAQAYENGYKAGQTHEREACAKVCESRFMGDMTREDMEARRCAAAIRARGTA